MIAIQTEIRIVFCEDEAYGVNLSGFERSRSFLKRCPVIGLRLAHLANRTPCPDAVGGLIVLTRLVGTGREPRTHPLRDVLQLFGDSREELAGELAACRAGRFV